MAKRSKRKWTVSELELVQEYLEPFAKACENGVESAVIAVKTADVSMTRNQLRYWQNCQGFCNWILTVTARRLSKLVDNG